MNSEKDINEIKLISRNYNKKKEISPIVSSTANFITEQIQTNEPISESCFISNENEDDTNNNKRKMKQILKLNENKLILSKKINLNKSKDKNKEKKNEEIYNYLMKNENMNNIQNIKEINEIYDSNELLNFIFSRLNKNQYLKCNIFLETENNTTNYILYSITHKFILSAKYDYSLFHNNYIIFTSRNFIPSTAISKLHSYLNKTEFILYDMGLSPKIIKNKKLNTSNNCIKIRRYLLQINYLNSKKFQNFQVYLPKKDYFQNYFYNMDENRKDKLNNKKFENEIDVLENNKPKFDINLKKYSDSYSSRVKEKSKYNFKIIYKNGNNKDDSKNYKSIECGKINDNNCVLDIGYPFSPVEGFSIALANFIKNK